MKRGLRRCRTRAKPVAKTGSGKGKGVEGEKGEKKGEGEKGTAMLCLDPRLRLRIIRSWVRTLSRRSRLRLWAVLPRSAEPRFRFSMLTTVSACHRCV